MVIGAENGAEGAPIFQAEFDDPWTLGFSGSIATVRVHTARSRRSRWSRILTRTRRGLGLLGSSRGIYLTAKSAEITKRESEAPDEHKLCPDRRGREQDGDTYGGNEANRSAVFSPTCRDGREHGGWAQINTDRRMVQKKTKQTKKEEHGFVTRIKSRSVQQGFFYRRERRQRGGRGRSTKPV